MQSIDLLASLSIVLSLSIFAIGYLVRLRIAGAVHYARVNAQGGSPLLSLRVMEFGYWCLQPLQRPCMRAGISADNMTATSLLFGLLAGVALAFGHLGLGALLAGISALGDALDGLLARATKTASAGGALFDASADRYSEFFLLGGLAFHLRNSAPLLGLALLALLGSFMISYGSAKAEAMRVPVPRGMMRRAERAVYLCGGLVLSPITGALADRAALPNWPARWPTHWTGELPILAALMLVAIVSNASAGMRLRTIARAASREVFLRPPVPLRPAPPLASALQLPPANPVQRRA